MFLNTNGLKKVCHRIVNRTPLVALTLISFVAFLVNASAQGRPPVFESPWRGYDTGAFAPGFDSGSFGPGSIAVGDLDNDGDSDVVTGNVLFSRPGLSVLLNGGDGTYDLPTFHTLDYNQSVGDIALADVNQDAYLDVLATVPDIYGMSNILVLWRNNRNGTFALPEQFVTGPGPVGIAVGDFNGDSFPDVATANYGYIANTNNTVSILMHNGHGGAAAGYLAPFEIAVPGMDTRQIIAADINGDRRADLAVVGIDRLVQPLEPVGARLAVLTNDGTGAFTVSATYISFPGARAPSYAVGLADLDHDGDADLIGGGVVTSGSTDQGGISVRRNAGNGSFGSVETYLFDPSVWVPSNFAIGDLNKDGFVDVVACTPSGRTMDGWVALINDGTGGFKPSVRYEASQQTMEAALADADGDGDIDVLTVAQSSAAVTVHKNSGDGSFPVLPRNLVGLESNSFDGNFVQALEAGDIDRDGDLDLVENDEKTYILKNNGDGTFAPAISYTPPHNFAEVKLRDLNGDLKLDLLFGPDPNVPPYNFATAINNGDGTFAAGKITQLNACQGGSIDAFDFDRDGDLDVAVTEDGSCRSGAGGRIFIARNDGHANFTLAQPILPDCLPNGIAGADLNADGNIDLVTSGCNGPVVFLGKGDLTFGPGITSSDVGPFRFKLSDLNHDGKLDIAMLLGQAGEMTQRIATALGNGDGTFAAAKLQSGSSVNETFRIANDIDVADADGDGDFDVLVTNSASNDLSLLLNNGDGTLSPHQRYGVGNLPTFSAFADFNGDGTPDIASNIGLPQYGLKAAIVTLRNLRSDTIVGSPNVTITSPTNGSAYNAPATIEVTVDVVPVQGRSISKVEFYLTDGNGSTPRLVHTDTTAPFEGFNLLNYPAGRYGIYAVAYDSEDAGISPTSIFTVADPPTSPATILFDSSSAAIGESAGILSLNVIRTGDASSTASVEYMTADLAAIADCDEANSEVASSRCDYVTATGRVTFATGETLKTIFISVIDDSYPEKSEQFIVTLNNALGANLGSRSVATITIADSDSGQAGNPIHEAEFFVREHYLDFLGRQPDASGLAFWTNQISACGSNQACLEDKRIHVSAAFFLSIEFQETGYLVYRSHKAAYGNLPGAPVPVRLSDFTFDSQQISQGLAVGIGDWQTQLENNKQAFFAEFVKRSRFTSLYPETMTPAQFVEALNRNAGDVLAQTEHDKLVSELTSGGKNRAQVLRAISEDADLSRQELNKAFVLMQYFGYLRRDPNVGPDLDFSGYNFWLAKLNEFNGNYVSAEMVKSFIVAGEYQHRFGK
jgi:hypothetical protein